MSKFCWWLYRQGGPTKTSGQCGRPQNNTVCRRCLLIASDGERDQQNIVPVIDHALVEYSPYTASLCLRPRSLGPKAQKSNFGVTPLQGDFCNSEGVGKQKNDIDKLDRVGQISEA